jgi:hypothetical protein
MKTCLSVKLSSVLLPAIFLSFSGNAQVASWNFNGSLAGTGSVNTIAGNASLGSTVPTGAFNGSTVYYGEGTWPGGGMDLNAYMEFSVTPTAGHKVTVSSVVMQIRRSTTGSSGAGPNTWSLRSSLDGYDTDLASGVLSMNSTPAITVSLGTSFINLSSKVTFRLYGYNATVSSGGLDRFVYDDITLSGSSILPLSLEYFNVKKDNQSADVSWKIAGEGEYYDMNIERSDNDADFELVKQFSADQIKGLSDFEYHDILNSPYGNYSYRIHLISKDGISSYSVVKEVSFNNETGFQVKSIFTGSRTQVSFMVNAEKDGNYLFSLFNMNGNRVALKSQQLSKGNQVLFMDHASLNSGIYILIAESGSQKICTKMIIP